LLEFVDKPLTCLYGHATLGGKAKFNILLTFFNKKSTKKNLRGPKNPLFYFNWNGFWVPKIKAFYQSNLKGFLSEKKLRQMIGGGFHFGFFSFMLIVMMFFGSSSLAELSTVNAGPVTLNSFQNSLNQDSSSLFLSQNQASTSDTPDLKIEDNFVSGVSTPDSLDVHTLGDVLGGGGAAPQNNNQVINYTVAVGDTVNSVAAQFNISTDTLVWANDLSSNQSLKPGQTLVILPVSGILYVVKAGDTINQLAGTYKANVNDIVSFNDLTNDQDIFVGDVLVIPGGTMPPKPEAAAPQALLPNSFFIYPAEGIITQGLHYYNAIDLANKCGTPIYAAASGTVQRATYGWNYGGGNLVTIVHSGGIVTYYGHLSSILVQPGQQVNVGDRIGIMGETGIATGCHVHFEVIGAANPLAQYPVGTKLSY